MDIRVLTADDAPSYRELRLQALKLNPEAFLTTYEEYVSRPIEQTARQLEPSEDNFTLGAFSDAGQLIGTVVFAREKAAKVRHIAHVYAMFVSPGFRRLGVGRMLLAELIERARRCTGLRQLQLTVVKDNMAARTLYESLGFRTYGIERQALMVGERYWDQLHMALTLDETGAEHGNANDSMPIQISPPRGGAEELWLRELWRSEWGVELMVSRGRVYQLADLKSLVARLGHELVGAATYCFDDEGGCELMSINAETTGGGIGTKLLFAVEAEARAAGCRRVWLITSNDNVDALRFYQRRGYRITAVHSGAIDEARRVKPTIPLVGEFGIEIHDEIELAKEL